MAHTKIPERVALGHGAARVRLPVLLVAFQVTSATWPYRIRLYSCETAIPESDPKFRVQDPCSVIHIGQRPLAADADA